MEKNFPTTEGNSLGFNTKDHWGSPRIARIIWGCLPILLSTFIFSLTSLVDILIPYLCRSKLPQSSGSKQYIYYFTVQELGRAVFFLEILGKDLFLYHF